MPRYALRSAVSVGSHYRAPRILRKRFLKKTLNKRLFAHFSNQTLQNQYFYLRLCNFYHYLNAKSPVKNHWAFIN